LEAKKPASPVLPTGGVVAGGERLECPVGCDAPVRYIQTASLVFLPMTAHVARRRATPPERDVAQAVHTAVEELLAGQGDSHNRPTSRHLRVAVAALKVAEAADRFARTEIMAARDEDGATWEDVGQALDITRQAAHERFRTGPDGMHSRLFAKKEAQRSSSTSDSGTSTAGSSRKARTARAARS
jgi:hypothetical protein